MFDSIITTANKYTVDNNSDIIDANQDDGSLMEFQKVIAIGDAVRSVKVGDTVAINPSNYMVRMHKDGSLKDGIISDNPVVSFNFKFINLDGIDYLFISERDIDFVITEFEEV